MHYLRLHMTGLFSILLNKTFSNHGPIHIFYHGLDLFEAILLKTKRKLKDVQGETLYDSSNPLEMQWKSKFWFLEFQTLWKSWLVFRVPWFYHNIDCIDCIYHHTISVALCHNILLSKLQASLWKLLNYFIWDTVIPSLCSPDSLMSRNSLEIRTVRGRAWGVLGRGMQPLTAGPRAWGSCSNMPHSHSDHPPTSGLHSCKTLQSRAS